MNRQLEPIQNGSNYPFREKMLSPNVKRSAFDWSHNVIFTLDDAGYLLPVFFEEVLPNSDYTINADVLLRVLPQVVPLYSDQRYYLQAFYSRLSDLWCDAPTYMTKGYSGNEVLEKPKLNSKNFALNFPYTVVPDTLLNAIGLPVGYVLKENVVNALPFMMYEQIYNWYFMNRNLYINNRVLLPNDMADFRLDSEGNLISNKYADSSSPALKFGFAHARDYPMDYFTSALPFQQRGDAPVLRFNASVGSFNADSVFFRSPSGFNGDVNFSSLVGRNDLIFGNADNVNMVGDATWLLPSSAVSKGGVLGGGNANHDPSPVNKFSSVDGSDIHLYGFKTGQISLNGNASFNNITGLTFLGGFTLDEFRNLAISQQELERMARTDGSFFEFGLTFFGQASRNAVDYRPTFIGGCYKRIAFSEVVQTSQSANSPLGTYAGHGIISDSSSLGSIHTDEHGYIMILLSVMPDCYYSQGISKKFTRFTQAEEFLPGRDKLGLAPILNKELYVSGDPSVDNDLFAYQNPFDDYRYKENRIIGKIADSSNHSFYPYTQSRRFTSTPTYSKEFFSATNIRKDYLAAPNEDAYTGKIRFNIRAVQPLTFTGTPAPVV